MFGVEDDKRGNGIQQPPWNATLFSLLKWEIRKRYRTIGIKAPETKPGFYRLYVRENKRLATYRKSRKLAPWLKDNHRDIESIE